MNIRLRNLKIGRGCFQSSDISPTHARFMADGNCNDIIKDECGRVALSSNPLNNVVTLSDTFNIIIVFMDFDIKLLLINCDSDLYVIVTAVGILSPLLNKTCVTYLLTIIVLVN